mmetsp:Transcript_29898/g.70463  ORF Transcript_29898/g.70463 Transcript_29898/m.70463 type:complete len:221 (-) Transcript_29898:242-904(-)
MEPLEPLWLRHQRKTRRRNGQGHGRFRPPRPGLHLRQPGRLLAALPQRNRLHTGRPETLSLRHCFPVGNRPRPGPPVWIVQRFRAADLPEAAWGTGSRGRGRRTVRLLGRRLPQVRQLLRQRPGTRNGPLPAHARGAGGRFRQSGASPVLFQPLRVGHPGPGDLGPDGRREFLEDHRGHCERLGVGREHCRCQRSLARVRGAGGMERSRHAAGGYEHTQR